MTCNPPPTRRAALAALALAGLCRPALAASPPGLLAPAESARMLDGMMRVDDGDPAAPRVRVVVSPGCVHSLAMWRESRPYRMRAAWRWIPFGGTPEGRLACAAALAAGTPEAMEACLEGTGPRAGSDGGMAAQDAALDGRIGMLLWQATSTPLGTPTTVYLRGGLAYAVRGPVPSGRIADLLDAAA